MVGDCSSICIAHILNFTVKKDPSDTIIKYAKQILQEEAKHATITLAREYGKHLIRLLREKLLKKKKKEKNEVKKNLAELLKPSQGFSCSFT